MRMKHITARPPYYGRRVKLILICIFFTAALILGQAVRSSAEDYVRPPGRTNLIRTSNIPDCYLVIECSGNTISARGCYADDIVGTVAMTAVQAQQAEH